MYFGRNFLNFEFSNEIFRKIPKFFSPVTSENEIFRRISAKFQTLVPTPTPTPWRWQCQRLSIRIEQRNTRRRRTWCSSVAATSQYRIDRVSTLLAATGDVAVGSLLLLSFDEKAARAHGNSPAKYRSALDFFRVRCRSNNGPGAEPEAAGRVNLIYHYQ